MPVADGRADAVVAVAVGAGVPVALGVPEVVGVPVSVAVVALT
ncbi:hypothetical protein [Streptomyces sp. NPDC057002]